MSTGCGSDPAAGPDPGTFQGMVNSQVLIATADDLLLDDLLRLAAAAGAAPQVESDLVGVRRHWQAASLVLVGRDLAEQVARGQPVRRAQVVVVGTDLDDAGIYQAAIAVGAEDVVVLPDQEAALSERLADCVDGSVGTAVTLAVVGGCGGAGASTLAAALAICGTRRGLRTMLVDGDPLGGGLDLLFGGEGGDAVRWPALVGTAGRVNAAALRSALPAFDDLAVLSWDRDDVLTMPPDAMRSVLGAAQRSSDLVVVDLPRRCDEAGEEALVRSTSALLVVPRDVRACAAAARVAGRVGLLANDLRVVARDSAVNSLTAGDLADHLALPLAGELRHDRDLPKQVDGGRLDPRPRTALGRVCAELLDRFGLYGRTAV